MVVAVFAVWVVQMAVHQVIDMVTMRRGLMAATRAVYMVCRVPVTLVSRCAAFGIASIHSQAVLVYMVAVRMVQVAVMQVVNVVIVFDRRVAAAWLVLVTVVGIFRTRAHADRLIQRCRGGKVRSWAGSARTIVMPFIDSLVDDVVLVAALFKPVQSGLAKHFRPRRRRAWRRVRPDSAGVRFFLYMAAESHACLPGKKAFARITLKAE